MLSAVFLGCVPYTLWLSFALLRLMEIENLILEPEEGPSDYRVRSALLEKAALLSPPCQHRCDFFSWSPVSKEVTALRSYSGC